MKRRAKVIAIDGPSYVGKSTIAQALARLTGYRYINTGHMYRAVARECMRKKQPVSDEASVVAAAKKMKIEFKRVKNRCLTLVNGRDVTGLLNAPELIRCASKVAQIGRLRKILTGMQRSYARRGFIIMEGRDIGTEVFPDAAWKFFITADIKVRAMRMRKMLTPKDRKRYKDDRPLIQKVKELDRADTRRKIAPLRKAKDAIVYDNSDSPTAAQDAAALNSYLKNPKAAAWKK